MSSDSDDIITLDERLRAVLLWDVPAMNAHPSTEPWRKVLEFRANDLGHPDPDDIVSLAAHRMLAALRNERDVAAAHGAALSAQGPIGELFAGLIALWAELDNADNEAFRQAFVRTELLVRRVDDVDVRARLLLRLAEYARAKGEAADAARALEEVLRLTAPETRLGVAARRRAAVLGVPSSDRAFLAATSTPEDPLLSYPWIVDEALSAAATLWRNTLRPRRAARGTPLSKSAERPPRNCLRPTRKPNGVEALICARPSGGWWHHALAQGDARSHEETLWALSAWMSTSTKRLSAVVTASERELDAERSARLLEDVDQDPLTTHAFVDVAAAVWDLVNGMMPTDLLRTSCSSCRRRTSHSCSPSSPYLLWRQPDEWTRTFSGTSPSTRGEMLSALDPHHADVMPEALRSLVLSPAPPDSPAPPAALLAALTYSKKTPSQSAPGLSTPIKRSRCCAGASAP